MGKAKIYPGSEYHIELPCGDVLESVTVLQEIFIEGKTTHYMGVHHTKDSDGASVDKSVRLPIDAKFTPLSGLAT